MFLDSWHLCILYIGATKLKNPLSTEGDFDHLLMVILFTF